MVKGPSGPEASEPGYELRDGLVAVDAPQAVEGGVQRGSVVEAQQVAAHLEALQRSHASARARKRDQWHACEFQRFQVARDRALRHFEPLGQRSDGGAFRVC